jgi:hypothetical protein
MYLLICLFTLVANIQTNALRLLHYGALRLAQ